MQLKEANGVVERIEEVLSVAYGKRLEPKLVDQIEARMGAWEAHIVEAAVHRHIEDTRSRPGTSEPFGAYPPTLAQILLHAENERSAVERSAPTPTEPAPEPDDDRFKWLDLPPDAARMLGRKRVQVDSWRSNCVECSDRGLTRFYHDTKDTARVWLFSEWLEMPVEMRDGLRCLSAVCDCNVGRFHRHREATTILWHKGQEREAPVWPRLEYIRKLADRRKRNDMMQVGAA